MRLPTTATWRETLKAEDHDMNQKKAQNKTNDGPKSARNDALAGVRELETSIKTRHDMSIEY